MEKQFVTYEIALKLNKLGFNEECLGYFRNNTKSFHLGEDTRVQKDSVLAPLWQQAIDWFREEYNIHISLLPHNDVEFGIRIRYNKSTLIHGGYKTYEEAREQAILKAIKLDT